MMERKKSAAQMSERAGREYGGNDGLAFDYADAQKKREEPGRAGGSVALTRPFLLVRFLCGYGKENEHPQAKVKALALLTEH